MPAGSTISINRAPVMTLWAAVVAMRLGCDEDCALTLGRAVCGLNAHSKAVALGLAAAEAKEKPKDKRAAAAAAPEHVMLLHRQVPVIGTPEGLRALVKDKPCNPDAVRRYLEGKFGDALPAAREAMERLAASVPKQRLADAAYELYERFRPEVPRGARGWGAKGVLDLARIRSAGE